MLSVFVRACKPYVSGSSGAATRRVEWSEGLAKAIILYGVMNSDSVESESSQLVNFSVRHAEIHLGLLDTSRWLP